MRNIAKELPRLIRSKMVLKIESERKNHKIFKYPIPESTICRQKNIIFYVVLYINCRSIDFIQAKQC